MRTVFKTTFAIAALVVGFSMAGCASGGGGRSADATGSTAQVAMMCPKCETVWMRGGDTANPSRVQAFSSKRQMVCPTCDDTAKTHLMSDGEPMVHDCPDCKATMVPVTTGAGPARPIGPRP